MDNDRIIGNWKHVKGKLREQYADITDDELEAAKADREQLEGLIQKRTGQTKDEARDSFDSILNSL